MSDLKHYLRPFWGYMILTMLIKLVGAVMELLIPYLMEVMLDVKVPAGDLSGIYLCGALMLVCAFFCLATNVIANRMSAVSSGKITQSIRHDLFKKLESLSAKQMDKLTTASAVSRLTSDTYNINQFLARTQRLGIRAPSLLIGGIIIMLSLDATLALVLIAMLPIIAVVVYLVTRTTIPLYTEVQNVLDKVVRVVQENITGIRVIKALSKTEDEKKRFHSVNEELTTTDQKAGTIAAITNPCSSLVLNLGLTVVVLVGALQVNKGETQPGMIVAFLQYFTMILNAMMGVTRIFVMWSKGEASAKRVGRVLELPQDLTVAQAMGEEKDAPHIEFRNVSFSYTGVGENLTNLSFKLEHGQVLGILGPTGCGKSTILNLLMRLYDPDKGQILIDGQDIRTMDASKLRQKFGVVFQNDFVTEGTIAHNIRFFRDLPDEALAQAAADAQAAAFIAEKEGGMDADVVVRGNNLSGGQKQRLLIARALAADPEILILDDSVSAVDTDTEEKILKHLRETRKGKTNIIIAHRISTLQDADKIIVIDGARIAEMGTHQELVAQGGIYADMYNRQLLEKMKKEEFAL